MTNNATWSAVTPFPSATDFTFTAVRTVATSNGTGGSLVYASTPATTGLIAFAIQNTVPGGAYSDLGVVTTGSRGANPPGVAFVVSANNGSGSVINYSASGGSFTLEGGSLGTVATGDWFEFFVDTGVGLNTSGTAQFWVRRVNSAGAVQSTWNGTSADPIAVTGGIPCAAMTSFVPAMWCYSGGGAYTLNGNANALPSGISPGNYLSLPVSTADQALSVTSVDAVLGGTATVSWVCENGSAVGPIEYSLDGGAFTAATGGAVSGSSGSFTIASVDNVAIHQIVIQDSSFTGDTSQAFYFIAEPTGDPSIYNGCVTTADNTLGHPEPIFEFSESATAIAFNLVLECASMDEAFGVPCFIELINSVPDGTRTGYGGSVLTFNVTFTGDGTEAGTTYTGQFGNPGNYTNVSGTGTICTVTGAMGNLSVAGGNEIVGPLSWESSEQTFSSSSFTFIIGNTTANIDNVGFGVGATRGAATMGAAVTSLSSAETLTLTGGTCTAGGTMTLTGGYSNAELTALNTSTDNGAHFAAGGATSITGSTSGDYTVSTTATYAAGTYTVVVQDATSMLESAPLVVVVASGGGGGGGGGGGNGGATETLTINDAIYSLGTLTVLGTCVNSTLTDLGLALDFGSFETAAELSVTGTQYSATLVGSLSAGGHDIQSKDISTGILSNLFPFDVGAAFLTFAPPVAPSQEGTNATAKANLISAAFGDGYVQRMGNGLNFTGRSQTLSWKEISSANWAAIELFFTQQQGQPFYYEVPGDIAGLRKWTATKWQRGAWNGSFYTGCTVTFTWDFTPDPGGDSDTVPTFSTTYDTWTPPVAPAADNSEAMAQERMNASTFGDNYVMQFADGINTLGVTQNLAWDMVLGEDWGLIEEFLAAHLNGQPFYYAFPNDPAGARLWTCSSYKVGTWNGLFFVGCSCSLQCDYTPPTS